MSKPLIGKPFPFVALDQTWTLGRFTFTVWEEFVGLIREIIPDPREEVDAILKACPEMPTEDKVAMIRDANKKYAGMFEFGSPDIMAWIKTPKCAIRLIYVLLKKSHPDATIDTAMDIINSGELDFSKALTVIMGDLPPKDERPGEPK